MQILCITHCDFESSGIIKSWATKNNHIFNLLTPYKYNYNLNNIELKNYDLLILMGGPQNLATQGVAFYNYLNCELDLIKIFIKNNKFILGICLGAQLIGEALGVKTEQSPYQEIGFFPLTLTSAAQNDNLIKNFYINSNLQNIPAFHWHRDMPGLTAQAEILAYSAGCPRQIIRYLPKVYGIQAHFEMQSSHVKKLVKLSKNLFTEINLNPTPPSFIQQPESFLKDSKSYQEINAYMIKILENINNL